MGQEAENSHDRCTLGQGVEGWGGKQDTVIQVGLGSRCRGMGRVCRLTGYVPRVHTGLPLRHHIIFFATHSAS